MLINIAKLDALHLILQRIFKNLASKYPSMTQSVINLLHSVITVLVDAQKKEELTAEQGQISTAPENILHEDGNKPRRYVIVRN